MSAFIHKRKLLYVSSYFLYIGKVWEKARYGDIDSSIACIRYYAGWADKVQGKTIEVRSISGSALISFFLDIPKPLVDERG